MTIPAAMAPLLPEFPALDRRIWILAAARVIVTAGFAAVMPFLAMHLAVGAADAGADRSALLWTAVGIAQLGDPVGVGAGGGSASGGGG